VVGQIVAAAGTALLPSITTTGDVNTGIFFSAANTVDIATDGVARAQINSAGDFAINSGYGSVATAYGCRAWVNFNGTGTPAIRGSGNVSSITDNGTGNYYVNLANSMPDTNYSVVVTKQNETSNLDSSVADAISSRLVNRIQLYTLEAGMASTFSDLKIELIGTGEQVGTWGSTTNINLGTALEEAIVGTASVPFSSADVTLTLTNTNGTQAARHLRLNLTGTSGGARQLILGSGCQIDKPYIINNGLADAVTVKNTTGTGVAVPAGKSMWVYNNGTNVVEVT
jgi:hypothetical protein